MRESSFYGIESPCHLSQGCEHSPGFRLEFASQTLTELIGLRQLPAPLCGPAFWGTRSQPLQTPPISAGNARLL